MKAHPEILFVGLLVLCVGMLKPSAWPQADASLTQATYFTYRMDQLKQVLALTPAQQQKVKPVVEQETSELMQYACNPATSRKEKVSQFNEVFRRSESGLRPLLTGEQSWTLHKLHDGMLEKFKTLKAPDSCTLAYWGRKTQ